MPSTLSRSLLEMPKRSNSRRVLSFVGSSISRYRGVILSNSINLNDRIVDHQAPSDLVWIEHPPSSVSLKLVYRPGRRIFSRPERKLGHDYRPESPQGNEWPLPIDLGHERLKRMAMELRQWN